jgi:AmiR/NasT family two-component response regulator
MGLRGGRPDWTVTRRRTGHYQCVRTAMFRSDGHADVSGRVGAEVARLVDNLALADQQLGHLRTALATNRRIGIAIGLLMALRKIGEEEAFELLRRASSHRNTELRLVAEDVIRTGTLC